MTLRNSFEKCSLCGDSDLDWGAIVFISGEEILCEDLESNFFVEEGISSDSPRCENIQSFYSGTCCIQAPEKPCNLCMSNGMDFDMNSNMMVSYDGEVQTCLEVSYALYARREQSSEHCTAAQEELCGQCCQAIHSQAVLDESPVLDTFSSSLTPSPTTQKPTPDYINWYAGALSSPASTIMVHIWLLNLSVAVGLVSDYVTNRF